MHRLPTALIRSHVVELTGGQMRAIGGSDEMAETDWMLIPTGDSFSSAVTIATPDAMRSSAVRGATGFGLLIAREGELRSGRSHPSARGFGA